VFFKYTSEMMRWERVVVVRGLSKRLDRQDSTMEAGTPVPAFLPKGAHGTMGFRVARSFHLHSLKYLMLSEK